MNGGLFPTVILKFIEVDNCVSIRVNGHDDSLTCVWVCAREYAHARTHKEKVLKSARLTIRDR